MATYVLTNDWDSIQERNIDPHSPVTSENHNKLLKAFGTSKLWATGLDISIISDVDNHMLVAELTRGICYVDFMVIEFIDNPTVEICGYTYAMDMYVVVDYTYRSYLPAPVATVKIIPTGSYDQDHQLILFKLHLGDWSDEQSFPSQTTADNWFTEESGNLVDYRVKDENLPQWAVQAFITEEGSETTQITIVNPPTEDTDGVNKAYVDEQIANHHSVHDPYFVRKYTEDDNVDDEFVGKVKDNVDIYLSDPELGIHDLETDGTGLLIKASGNYVTFENTKRKYIYNIDGKTISEINSDGVTGALWNADIAEYFDFDPNDPEMKLLPEPGTCICVKNGKAHISNMEGDPSCVGFVSYTPAYVLGGSVDYTVEFKVNHRIPVAIAGQLKQVCVYTNGREKIEAGAVLVSGLDGRALAVSPNDFNYPITSIIGKALVPIYPGENDNVYVLVKS